MNKKTEEKTVLPAGITAEEFEKQLDEYMRKSIEDSADKYRKEIADGTFIPLKERLKRQVENGELTQAEADDMLELVTKYTDEACKK
jgi:hypothetical protein